ncbi:xenotropic and polytropic retrovirus receptor 1 [Labeo rohita]|uniref:Xenotropic and polytropic retrovirus receptor 1 n=1 Tax=Labeo rohita TaxID=84645 RepID=A0A498MSR3_LABRO|nr:xenotropic and polytropic retrovirus receptor 1 [Labeo rohita]
MTFSNHPALQMIPEWKKQYISYETLKSLLNKEDRLNLICYVIIKHFTGKSQRSVTEEFFKSCEEELNKVNLFYSEKLSEAHNRLATFGIVAPEVCDSKAQGDNRVISVFPPTKRRSTNLKQIKMAVGELYLSLAFLQKYQEFNYKCFCKVTIKYDSKFSCERGLKWRNEMLDTSLLNTDRGKCEHLMSKLETFMIQLEGGDKLRAMKRLEIPPMDKTPKVGVWIMFRIGFACGLIMALLTTIAFRDLEPLKPQLQLYKGSFLLIEFLFLIGLNLYCFNISAINHTLIFGLDPRDHLSYYHIFEISGGLTVCWCISVLANFHPAMLSVPQHLHPLLFHSFLLFLLLNPFSIFHTQARRWLMVTMSKVLAAPFQPVGFAECWLADQFNSLSPLFLGLRDLLCFYTYQISWRDMWSDSSLSAVSLDCGQYSMAVTCLIQCFPPWLRFAQCLRCFWDTGHTLHLLNAGKYFTVFLMVTFAGLYNMARERSTLLVEGRIYLYIWAMATCTGVLVTVSWDLRMDWGLLEGNGLLKDELLFSQQSYYYAAMLADVLLRVSWAINILLAQMKDSAAAATASALLAPLEVLRLDFSHTL